MISMPEGGRFTAVNVPLGMLIRYAYELQDFQLFGGPSWIASDRFDIVANAAATSAGWHTPTAPGVVFPGWRP